MQINSNQLTNLLNLEVILECFELDSLDQGSNSLGS
jgi:hypothetical protein